MFIDGKWDQAAWEKRAQAKRDELALAREQNHEVIVNRVAHAFADGDFARECVRDSANRRVAITLKGE